MTLRSRAPQWVLWLLLLSVCGLGTPSTFAQQAATEPTNAKEAAEKKAAEDAAIDAKYQAFVATLPAEQQAWEKTLQENLGGFYLPIHKRSRLQGRSSCWDFVTDDPQLPRVLLIGDSVSGGYTLTTRKLLAGRANVHKAPENCGPSSNGLKKLDVWLGSQKWDLIHFNFGIHDRRTPLDRYEQQLEELIGRLKQTGAKLVWAATTPVPAGTKDGEQAPAWIRERNQVAAKLMQKHGIVINDLHSWMLPELSKFQKNDDVHFNGPGYDRIAERVARVIDVALPQVAGVNPAIKPVGQLELDGYIWSERHQAVLEAKDRIKPEIVLIGDSITHFWGGEPDGGRSGNRGKQAWQSLFGEWRVLNLGFGWDRTQNVLKRIELGELDGITPQAIVIHIGTNNLAGTPHSRACTPDEIAAGITRVVEQAQTKCPQAKVILMAVFPRGRGATNPQRETINAINQKLAGLSSKSGVVLLDITQKWLAEDGSVSTELMPDTLHPNEKGYAVWAEALRPHLP